MCSRSCPNCGSSEHFISYGLAGTTIYCEQCPTVLAWAADPEAAPIGLSDEEAEAWARQRRGVLPGAEASDPQDDVGFIGPAFERLNEKEKA